MCGGCASSQEALFSLFLLTSVNIRFEQSHSCTFQQIL